MCSICRINIHQDGAEARACQVQQYPLHAIGLPQADSVAGFEPQSRQATGHAFHFHNQLRESKPHALMADNQRVVVRKSLSRFQKGFRDRLLQERDIGAF